MRRSGLALAGIAILLVAVMGLLLAGGCKSKSPQAVAVAPPPGPPGGTAVVSAQDLPIELTGPQCDDQGHYVPVRHTGSVVVNGLVECPQPPTEVIINGVSTVPYLVQDIVPYGATASYPCYRFHVPVVLVPQDRLYVRVVGPGYVRNAVYAPDRVAVLNRWHTLYVAQPANPWVAMRLASACYADQQYATAFGYLQKATTYDRKSPWLLYDLGMTALALHRANDALDYFGRGVAIYPACPDLYYGRGLVYYTTNSRDAAIRNFVKASNLFPDWAEPLAALALTYYVDRKFSDAVVVADRARAVWPSWPAPVYELATVRLAQGRNADALALLGKAEKLGPWRANHHEMLAEKLMARGNYNAAWQQVRIARAVGGSPPAALVAGLNKHMRNPGPMKVLPWRGKVVTANVNSGNVIRGKRYNMTAAQGHPAPEGHGNAAHATGVAPARAQLGGQRGSGVGHGGGAVVNEGHGRGGGHAASAVRSGVGRGQGHQGAAPAARSSHNGRGGGNSSPAVTKQREQPKASARGGGRGGSSRAGGRAGASAGGGRGQTHGNGRGSGQGRGPGGHGRG